MPVDRILRALPYKLRPAVVPPPFIRSPFGQPPYPVVFGTTTPAWSAEQLRGFRASSSTNGKATGNANRFINGIASGENREARDSRSRGSIATCASGFGR
jgi:hypothetical protein